MQQHATDVRQNESPQDRQSRLQTAADNAQQVARITSHSTKQHYLHQKGWSDSQSQLHEQPWVKNTMSKFHKNQSKWQHRLCIVCHEVWPTQNCLNHNPDTYTCTRCKRDKSQPKRYSNENDMDPGVVPPSLQKLSQVEECLLLEHAQ